MSTKHTLHSACNSVLVSTGKHRPKKSLVSPVLPSAGPTLLVLGVKGAVGRVAWVFLNPKNESNGFGLGKKEGAGEVETASQNTCTPFRLGFLLTCNWVEWGLS